MSISMLRLTTLGSALALASFAFGASQLRAQTPRAKPIDDPAAYVLYSVLIPDTAMHTARDRMIVIQAEAAVDPSCWPFGPPIEAEWKSAFGSLKAENVNPRQVLPGFSLKVPYIVLPKADIMGFFRPGPFDGWKNFYAAHPDSDGFAAVSAVGFDPDRTRAIVYFAHHYGNQGSDEAYHLLRKIDGAWQDVRVPGVNTCHWQA